MVVVKECTVMSSLGKMLGMSLRAACLALILAGFTGCTTGSDTAPPRPSTQGAAPAEVDLLRAGDPVTITFSGVANVPNPHSERVKDDGTLTLPLNLRVKAEGLTRGQLQQKIYDIYVPNYFREQLTVTVQTENRFYFVNGEVRLPQRITYSGETTVMRAIASAGGFTDFANRRKVRVTRANGERLVVDCVKALTDDSADRPIYPGDRVEVERRLF